MFPHILLQARGDPFHFKGDSNLIFREVEVDIYKWQILFDYLPPTSHVKLYIVLRQGVTCMIVGEGGI